MSGVAYPDTYLAVVISAHIVFGAIAAFVLCPLAIFARKGSRLHRRAGQIYMMVVVLICVSGMLALLDPDFLAQYWKQESVAKGFGEIFQASQNPTMFFLFLVVMLAYMSFSAVRLWPRTGYGRAERIHSNPFDWVLTAIMAAYAMGFLVIGIEDLLSHNKYATTFLGGALLMLGFVGFDIYTFVAKPRVGRHRWWILHMTKLCYAWAGLLDAFWIRLRVYVLPEDLVQVHLPVGTILWLGLTLAGFILHRKSMRPTSEHR